MGAKADPPTTVTLPASVRRRLRDYQEGGKSVADTIAELMDEVPPDYLRRDLRQAMAMGPRLSLEDFRKRHRLAGRRDSDSLLPHGGPSLSPPSPNGTDAMRRRVRR